MSDYTDKLKADWPDSPRDGWPWLTYEQWAEALEGHRPGSVAELGDSARREYDGGCGAAWIADRLETGGATW